MDPIPEVNDDDARPVATPPVAPPAPVEPLPSVDTVPEIDSSTADAGTLGETESLLGAVMTGDPDAEAVSLRRALELDDRPPTATPSVDEQVEQSAQLRRTVTGASTGATTADPTEQYEVHDAALGGDPIAQAIDDTANAQRAGQAQAAQADLRDDSVVRQEHVPAATDRATQDAGAQAATQAGAGRPATRSVTDGETEEERIERVEQLDRSQRVRPVRSREAEER